MRREGMLSWLIVLAALALPSGSLYFWLTGTVDESHAHEQTIRRQRETPIFSAPPVRENLVNPMARQPEVRFHEAEKPLPEPAQAQAQAQAEPVVSPKPMSAPVATVKPEPAQVAEVEAATESDFEPAPAAKVASSWTPKRDPMLSPSEEAIVNAPVPDLDAPAPAPVARRARRVRAKPLQDTVSVEAIIAMAGEASAIVNGTAVKVGDMVGRLKVVMITGDAVTFAYGATRFAKAL